MKFLIPCLLLLTLPHWVHAQTEKPLCPTPWVCQKMLFSPNQLSFLAGYLPEKNGVPFRGNVIYFEGYGDSMLNHGQLFQALTDAGFRVIAFDYPGQGGSDGSMENFRMETIPLMGLQAWTSFALQSAPKMTIIGYSTGGLAAYMAAHETGNGRDIDKVVLLAPQLAPRLQLNRSIVRDFDFLLGLRLTAKAAREWVIPQSVAGLAILSGKKDTHTDSRTAETVLKKTAPHFKISTYADASHDLDHERVEIALPVFNEIVEFLKTTP